MVTQSPQKSDVAMPAPSGSRPRVQSGSCPGWSRMTCAPGQRARNLRHRVHTGLPPRRPQTRAIAVGLRPVFFDFAEERTMPAKSRVDAAKKPAATTGTGDDGLAAYCPTSMNGRRAGATKTATLHPVATSLNRMPQAVRDNVWLLGGELIRRLHEEPRNRRRSARELILAAVDEEGGPLIRRGTEEEQRSFDATCRKLHRFLQTRDNP